jgi:inhibitor of KinA
MKKNAQYTFKDWHVQYLGDHAIVFLLPSFIDQNIIAQIMRLHFFIASKKIKGIKDLIPSYHSLTIVYDISIAKHSILNSFACKDMLEFGNQLLMNFFKEPIVEKENKINNEIIKIPVCYDIEFGIDLKNLAELKNINIEEIVKIHTSIIYNVYCLGFMPGFAYMGKVDPLIQMNRHSKPRPLVYAGSVGIAGAQTGIYPMNAPGGWQIIGRTPIQIFDPINLAKFKMGDRIQFYSIDKATYLATTEYPTS